MGLKSIFLGFELFFFLFLLGYFLRLKAQCTHTTTAICSLWPYSKQSSVRIQTTGIQLVPSIVFQYSQLIGECSDAIIDASGDLHFEMRIYVFMFIAFNKHFVDATYYLSTIRNHKCVFDLFSI